MNKILNRLTQGEHLQVADFEEAWGQHLPLLKELKNCPQDELWHAEGDVHIHTDMVLIETYLLLKNEAAQLDDHRKLILILAALLHDIAKPLCTRTIERNGRQCLICPGHEQRGYDYLCTHLPQLDLPMEIIDAVCNLVARHQQPKRLILRESTEGAWRQLATNCDSYLLYLLELADMRGRECADWQSNVDYIELFRLGCQEYALWDEKEVSPWNEWQERLQEAFPKASDKWLALALVRSSSDWAERRIHSFEEARARAHSLPKSFAELIILSGPAGCGKSRYVANLGEDYQIISMDDIREKICGKRNDQRKNGQVLQLAREMLKQALRQHRKVVWDATSLRREMRQKILQLGKDYGAFTSIVTFRMSRKDFIKGNADRPHSIPQSSLVKQLNSFEFPLAEEADQMLIVNNKGQIE